MTDATVRVLVIDDSPLCAEALRSVIDADPRMRVAGVGHDGLRAIELATALRPTVITMDVHMPRMNGLEAVTRIVAEHPARILVVTEDDARDLAFEALRRGAADLVRRPHPRADWAEADREDLRRRILALARAPLRGTRPSRADAPPAARIVSDALRPGTASVVGIAASTGGPVAIASLLAALPARVDAAILVVQHLARGFTESFVRWLGRASALPVRVARDGEPLAPGEVRIAPEDAHLTIDRLRHVRLDRSAPAGGHRPSADRLFASLAAHAGPHAVGVVLTGMGRDGAEGLLALRRTGATTLAQDERSCVVFGMPRAARDAGAAAEVLPLDRIASRVAALVARREGP